MRKAWRILCLFVLLGSPCVAAQAPPHVVVNGRSLQAADVAVVNQRVYVAVRPVGDAFGAYVTTNAKSQTVTVTTLLRQAVLHLGDVHATVNGEGLVLAAPPQRVGQKIMLPLRALAEVFGASITYKAKTHGIIVANQSQNATATPYRPPAASTKTFEGTVTAIDPSSNPGSIQFTSGGETYAASVPREARIEFRDIHGAMTGNSTLSAVRPGDALIVTLSNQGQLISMADIFASISGTIAGLSGQSMVLQSGRVITADSSQLSVTLDGIPASLGALEVGDKVSVRADPVSGVVHEVVALTPRGITPHPQYGSFSAGTQNLVTIANVSVSPNRALHAGDTLVVAFDGSAGGHAGFDLSDIIPDNPMRETRPGHYEGTYRVSVGTNLTDAPVIVRLTKGVVTRVAEAPDPLSIITTPPRVLETAPRALDQINVARPNIVVTFSTVGNTGMDAASLHLRVNGRDVTARATRTASFISYYPPSDLQPGPVEVEVKGTDIAGNAVFYHWSFEIQG